MTTETMTIHRALAELKVLENRINKVIYDAKFCAAVKQSMKKVNGVSLEDFKVASQSSLDMVRDLIARQEAIKKAISVSNAKTVVVIAGKEYSVAEAIYMNQHGIDFKSALYVKLSDQYSAAIRSIETSNAQLSDRADRYVANGISASEKANMDANTIKDMREDYIDRETMILVDGISIKQTMDNLAAEIDKFKAEVDAVLSTSNATTEITITY